MAAITFDAATVTYPQAPRPAVDSLDLVVGDGEFLVLLGPSGCGKSSVLHALAGLLPLTRGRISIGGRDVTDLSPRERDVAMVFQNYALYPHLTVAENIAFPLEMAGLPRREIAARVSDAARMLDLTDCLGRRPRHLSGGQQQRVALGRALVRRPQAFLMDEPLSNLDANIRVQTRTDIAVLQRRLGTTTLYVTHDQAEAMTMGDRVAVLREGVLRQVGAPGDLYRRPVDTFVARFIGSPAMNLVEAPLTAEGADLGRYTLALPPAVVAALAAQGARTAVVGFRPESVDVVDAGDGMPFEVLHSQEQGHDAYAHGMLHGGPDAAGPEDLLQVVRVDPGRLPARGEVLGVRVRAREVHVFSPLTGLRMAGGD